MTSLRTHNWRRSYHKNHHTGLFTNSTFEPRSASFTRRNIAALMWMNVRAAARSVGQPTPRRILCLPAPSRPTKIVDLSTRARAKYNRVILLPDVKPRRLLTSGESTRYKVGDILRVPKTSFKREISLVEHRAGSVIYGFKQGKVAVMCSEQSVIAAQAIGYRA